MYEDERIGTPIKLSSSAVLAPNGNAAIRSGEFKNSTGAWVLIDNISFSVSSNIGYLTSFGTAPNIGGAVSAILTYKHDTKEEIITNGDIPIWGFGQIKDPAAETLNTQTTLTTAYGDFRWVMRRPMALAPGAELGVAFQNTNVLTQSSAGGPANITLTLSLGGRRMRPGFRPDSIWIPYVTNYSSTLFPLDGTARSETSSEVDLMNILDVPVEVDYITGRLPCYFVDTSGSVPSLNIDESSLLDNDGDQTITVRLIHSTGAPVTAGNVSFRMLFASDTRSLEASHTMPSKSYYSAVVNCDGAPLSTNEISTSASVQPQITIVGAREIFL